MIRLFAVAIILVACARSDTRRADSGRGDTAGSRLTIQLPAETQKLLDSIDERIRKDTSLPANKQLNLMTAPIDVIPLNAFESDTLQWVARADSCAMVVRSFGPTGALNGFGGAWMSVAEGSGTIGPGGSVDVSPSPDWKWIAYASTVRLSADSTRWQFGGVPLSSDDVKQLAESRADGSLWITFAVVEPDPEGCMGDGCPTPLVSPVHGGWRIGWTANSRYLLLARRGDSLHWSVIDPATRKAVAAEAQTPAQLNWATRAVASAADAARAGAITGGGSYSFTARGDSIVVRGPDRSGRTTDRIVGAGVPVAVTRNGQYLLAVRREKSRVRAVIYSFRLFHAMLHTSCD